MAKFDLTESTNEKKLKLLSLVSHEIRTPLHGIIGLTEQLTDTMLDADQRELVDHLIRTEKILMNLVNDVLDYTKLKEEAFDIRLKPSSLISILEEVRSLFISLADQKGITLQLQYRMLSPFVKIDELRIKQVLTNLVNNALKFTDKGTIWLRCTQLESDSQANTSDFLIEVEDSGTGIPAGFEEKIFEEYFQTDEGSTKSGTGLGLTISNMILRKMGSHLEVKKRSPQEQNQGALFHFTLSVENATAATPQKNVFHHQFGDTKALVVDDDRLILQITERMLTKEGIYVTKALSLGEAKSLLDAESFDLVLLDMELKDGSGQELVHHLKARNFAGTVICCTASTESKEYIRKLGFDWVLKKPFNRRALSRALSKISEAQQNDRP